MSEKYLKIPKPTTDHMGIIALINHFHIIVIDSNIQLCEFKS
jgi:hypothetical protein